MIFADAALRVSPPAAFFAALCLCCCTPSVLAQPPAPNTAPIPAENAVMPAEDVLIRSVVVDGAKALPTSLVVETAAAVGVGKTGSRENLRAVSGAVRGLYRDKGFLLAQVVSVELDAQTGVLHVTIVEGIITRIVVRGNKKTRTKTILSALSLHQGDVYHDSRIKNDRNRLDRLGVFSDVSITTQLPGTPEEAAPSSSPADATGDPVSGTTTGDVQKGAASPSAGASGTVPAAQTAPPKNTPPSPLEVPEDQVGQVELVVRVKERSTINVAATLGYSDGSGAVGFADVSEDNVAGLAQRASVQWQRTTRGEVQSDGSIINRDSRAAFNLSYNAPALGAQGTGYGVDVYQKNTVFLPFFSGNQSSLRSYEKRRGATVRVLRTLGSNLSGFVSLRNDRVGYDAIPSDLNPPYGELARATATVGALGVGLVDDARDRADNPRTGFLHSITYEKAARAFGGDRAFGQTTVDLREYAPLSLFSLPSATSGSESRAADRTPIVAVRVLGGFSTGDVPLSENYFLGGYDLLRGYDLYSVRGTRMLMGTGEVRLPLGSGTQAVVFADAGNAWPTGQRVSLQGFKVGGGAGLRFLSPIGPIRFDAAYGSRLRTYVTLGQSF